MRQTTAVRIVAHQRDFCVIQGSATVAAEDPITLDVVVTDAKSRPSRI